MDGKTVTAKRNKTKLLPEVAQMLTSGWSGGATMLQTEQFSEVAAATQSQIAVVQNEFPRIEKFNEKNQIRTTALVEGFKTAAASSLVEEQVELIEAEIKTEEKSMKADTKSFASTMTVLNDSLRVMAMIGGGEQVDEKERKVMRTRLYAKLWLLTQKRIQTGTSLGAFMRGTCGGDSEMWAKMIACRDDKLPPELQSQLTEHMRNVKEMKISMLLAGSTTPEEVPDAAGGTGGGGHMRGFRKWRTSAQDSGGGWAGSGRDGDSVMGDGEWPDTDGNEWVTQWGTAETGNDRSHVQCYGCGEWGHYKSECTRWKGQDSGGKSGGKGGKGGKGKGKGKGQGKGKGKGQGYYNAPSEY